MTAYDVEAVLQEQGYDSDSLLDELVYQVSNTGVEYELSVAQVVGQQKKF